MVHSGQIHTIRDVLSAPPANATMAVRSSSMFNDQPVRWFYDPGSAMSADLMEFTIPQESGHQNQEMQLGFLNHPMYCFFLAHCLVELQKFGSQALAVVKTLYSGMQGSAEATEVYCPFCRSPAVLVQEALALYSIRDYSSSQVSPI